MFKDSLTFYFIEHMSSFSLLHLSRLSEKQSGNECLNEYHFCALATIMSTYDSPNTTR